jgi:DNA-binding NarL/FixJ family response regulator
MNQAIKLLLVEDHKLLRVGLKSLFEEQDGLEVTSEAQRCNRKIPHNTPRCNPYGYWFT